MCWIYTTQGRLHIDLRLNLLLTRMIPLSLRAIVIVTLYNVAEIQTVLYGRSAYLLRPTLVVCICAQILQLLSLLSFFHSFAPEILKISETPIVFNVINHSGEVLLLLIRGSYGLVHYIQMGRMRLR